MPITVSIVEDNEQLRETLARVLNRADGFECVGQHASAEAGLEGIPKERPNAVLMDINLPGMNGVECVRQLKQLLPQTQVVMLTAYEDTENIFSSLAAGASGYLLKRSKSAEILEALARCAERRFADVHAHRPQGGAILSVRGPARGRAGRSGQPNSPRDLSPREQEVLDLLSQGFMYKEISDKLGISFETVRTYIRRIYEKLHVRTRTEAVAKVLRR